ncbi:hypothetical protein TNCV_4592641 [Trichonephila clavipes]|nr:hypothetical protein TNCV_4592641 [Trichonephila clavipes]
MSRSINTTWCLAIAKVSLSRHHFNLSYQRVGGNLRRGRFQAVVKPFFSFLKMRNAMAQVVVKNNISKRWNTTENDVSKNQSSADSAIRLPNTSILNSNVSDITEHFLDVYQTTLY